MDIVLLPCSWRKYLNLDNGISHVIPLADTKAHELSNKCWCHPEDDLDEETEMWMHNSADGREAFEEGRRKLS